MFFNLLLFLVLINAMQIDQIMICTVLKIISELILELNYLLTYFHLLMKKYNFFFEF